MDYRAPPWLPDGHSQTIYSAFFAPRPAVDYRRERWDTPDGDFIDLDWTDGPERGARGAERGPESDPDERIPLVVLFHGLEGSSRSHYALALMRQVRKLGWRGVVVHFRGCSGEPNLLPRAYHSGDSAEIDWILRRLRAEHPSHELYATGVSLGGNALLKWLGEQAESAKPVVARACAVSAPVDLMAAGEALGRGFNRVYARYFLSTLKRKSLAKLKRHPGLFDRRRVMAARTLREFDEVVTAPLHGFAGTDDYWTRASSKPWLARIAVPTLLLNARNDPFLPAWALPQPAELSPLVTAEFPDSGGHAGFVAGRFPGHLGWLPERICDFFHTGAMR
jgi:predicted alpha/beta-fold hydrolase